MKVLIDTNVLLDVALRRWPFYIDAVKVFQQAKDGKIKGHVSVVSLKDMFYISGKSDRKLESFDIIEEMSSKFNVIDATAEDSVYALASDVKDYEDGLLVCSAIRNGMDAIITRNEKDFYEKDILIINPRDMDRYVDNHVEVKSMTLDGIMSGS
jgi:predicted nucleic acid-binding protein